MISVVISLVAAIAAVAAAAGFYAAGVGVVMALPWWLALAAPATLYAVLAAVGVTGVPVAARAAVFGALCAVHAVLAAATAAVFTLIAPVGYLDALSAAVLSFLPVPLIPVTAAPLVLLPFRGLLAPPPRPGRPASIPTMDQRAGRRAEPRDAVAPAAASVPAAPRPVVLPSGTSGATSPRSPSASPFASPFRNATTPPTPVPAPVVPEPVEPEPVIAAPRRTEPIVVAAREAEAVRLAEATVQPPVEMEPVVAEAPIEAAPFAEAPPEPEDQDLESLGEPAVVETPTEPLLTAPSTVQPVVAAEASSPVDDDDFITVSFDRIAGQLPAEAFTQSVSELAAGLPEPGRLRVSRAQAIGQLANGVVRVGWDDIARQLPRAARSVSDEDIASRIGPNGIVLPLDEVLRALPPEVLSVGGAAPDLGRLENFPLPFQPPAPPVASVAAAVEAPAPPEPPAPRAVSPQAVEVERLEREVDTLLAPPATPHPPARVDPPAAAPASSFDREAVRLAATLAPLGGVAVAVGRVDDDGRFTVVTGGVSADGVASTVRLCLPLLDRTASPGPVEQVVVRRDNGAVVLTPLGRAGLLVASSKRDSRLALVEMRCREAARESAAALTAMGEMPSAPRHSNEAAPELTVVAGGPAAELLARSVTAFGPLALTVLRGEPRLELCMLLPPGDDVQAIGRLVWAALDLARDAEGGRVDSIEIRLGERRLLVRPTDTPGRFTALGLDGDAAHRAGWAHVQMLHATARLEAA